MHNFDRLLLLCILAILPALQARAESNENGGEVKSGQNTSPNAVINPAADGAQQCEWRTPASANADNRRPVEFTPLENPFVDRTRGRFGEPRQLPPEQRQDKLQPDSTQEANAEQANTLRNPLTADTQPGHNLLSENPYIEQREVTTRPVERTASPEDRPRQPMHLATDAPIRTIPVQPVNTMPAHAQYSMPSDQRPRQPALARYSMPPQRRPAQPSPSTRQPPQQTAGRILYVEKDGRLYAHRKDGGTLTQATPPARQTQPQVAEKKPNVFDRMLGALPFRKSEKQPVSAPQRTVEPSPQPAPQRTVERTAPAPQPKSPTLVDHIRSIRPPKWMAFGRSNTEERR